MLAYVNLKFQTKLKNLTLSDSIIFHYLKIKKFKCPTNVPGIYQQIILQINFLHSIKYWKNNPIFPAQR